MNEFDDLSGNTYGHWKVIRFDHMKWNGTNHKHGMSYYLCECINCGHQTIKARSNLLQHPNRKCMKCGVKVT